MELAFETEDLRTMCERESEAVSALGPEVARALRHRLADIAAASAVSELPAGNPRVIPGNSNELLYVDLGAEHFLALVPNHRRNPTTEDGSVDWSRVWRLKLIKIGSPDVDVQS